MLGILWGLDKRWFFPLPLLGVVKVRDIWGWGSGREWLEGKFRGRA